MFTPGEDEREWAEDWTPPPEITREHFLEWRAARRGSHPAEDQTNPVWLWILDTNVTAFHANDHFKGPNPYERDTGPGWCFNRFGRTVTDLPDGRRIIISGEHEDSYDPDFFIYNDVVVVESDGRVRILGYPEEHFPPTDSHSATLLGDSILLIGNLGYGHFRRPGDTQVMRLDLGTMEFSAVETTGEKPGWISRHEAELQDGSIVIRDGMIQHAEDYLENFDSWRLDLGTWQWTRLTRRTILRWHFYRAEPRDMNLWRMRMAAVDDLLAGIKDECLWMTEGAEEPDIAQARATLQARTDGDVEEPLAFDRELLNILYDPPVPHTADRESAMSGQLRYIVDDVVIRFDEEIMSGVYMTVEGELPEAMLAYYVEQVRERLGELEGCEYFVQNLKA